jgi:SPOR domain
LQIFGVEFSLSDFALFHFMPLIIAAAEIESLLQNAADIIRAASASPLGILALMVLALSILAVYLLRDVPPTTRVIIYVLLFLGVAVYTFAITRESQLRPSTSAPAAEAKPVEVKPLLSNSEWIVFIGQYNSEDEAKRKQQAAARVGYSDSEIFRQGRYLHLRFRFSTQQEAEAAAAKLKQAGVSHEPDVSRSRP